MGVQAAVPAAAAGLEAELGRSRGASGGMGQQRGTAVLLLALGKEVWGVRAWEGPLSR